MFDFWVTVLIFVLAMLHMLFEASPFLFWILILGAVGFIIYCFKSSSSSGNSYSGYSGSFSSCSSEMETTFDGYCEDQANLVTNEPDEAFLYQGYSKLWKSVTATYRNGQVFEGYYSGLDWKTVRATVKDGYVYEGTITGYLGTVIGRIDDKYIYRGNSAQLRRDIIAHFENGYIYLGDKVFHTEEDIIGCYEGNPVGAAACALAFLL